MYLGCQNWKQTQSHRSKRYHSLMHAIAILYAATSSTAGTAQSQWVADQRGKPVSQFPSEHRYING